MKFKFSFFILFVFLHFAPFVLKATRYYTVSGTTGTLVGNALSGFSKDDPSGAPGSYTLNGVDSIYIVGGTSATFGNGTTASNSFCTNITVDGTLTLNYPSASNYLKFTGLFTGTGTLISTGSTNQRLNAGGTPSTISFTGTVSGNSGVTIQNSSSLQLVANATLTGGVINFSSGATASLNLNGFTLTATNITSTATATIIGGSTSNITLVPPSTGSGSSTSNLAFNQTTPGTSNALNNLTVSGTSTYGLNVAIITNASILGTLSLDNGSGSFFVQAGSSSASATVSISNITRTSGYLRSQISTGIFQFVNSSSISFPGSSIGSSTFPACITFAGTGAANINGAAYFNKLTINSNSVLNAVGTTNTNINFGNSQTGATAPSFVNNGSLVIQSGSATARIPALPSNITISGSGLVTVQQYLSSKRGWRLLGNPTGSNISLSSFATSSNININNGTNVSSTAYAYDNSKLSPATPWVASSGTWGANTGLLLFVRGTAGQGVGGGVYTPSNVTLSATGSLVYGTQASQALSYDASNTNKQWNLIVNPYPAPVSVKSITGIYGNANINQSIYYFNPNAITSNAYTADGDYSFVTLGASQDFIIPSMGAIFVQTQASGQSVQFSESSKSTTSGNQGLFGEGQNDYRLIDLQMLDATGNQVDRVNLLYDKYSKTTSKDHWDLPKLSMGSQSLYTLGSDREKLAIDSRSDFSDSISLCLKVKSAGSYRFHISSNSLYPNHAIELYDKLLSKSVLLDTNIDYEFAVDNNSLSQGEGRFILFFKKQSVSDVLVGEQTDLLRLRAYPNPTMDYVSLSCKLSSGNSSVRVAGLDGKIYKTIANVSPSALSSYKLSMGDLPRGVYMVSVVNGDQTFSEKITKN